MEKNLSAMDSRALLCFSVVILGLCLVVCEVKEMQLYAKSEGILHVSPYSKPVVHHHPSAVSCARQCEQEEMCVLFSYCPHNGSCILSGRVDYDANNYDVTSTDWNTFSRECPLHRGYVLNNTHSPPLCLRYVSEPASQALAATRCEQEGARLVRVKTLEVYSVVQQVLIEAGCIDEMVWVGADDRAVEGNITWNDGTRLRRFTDMWRDANEGGKESEDCFCVSSTKLLIDTNCTLSKTFICQYDV